MIARTAVVSYNWHCATRAMLVVTTFYISHCDRHVYHGKTISLDDSTYCIFHIPLSKKMIFFK